MSRIPWAQLRHVSRSTECRNLPSQSQLAEFLSCTGMAFNDTRFESQCSSNSFCVPMHTFVGELSTGSVVNINTGVLFPHSPFPNAYCYITDRLRLLHATCLLVSVWPGQFLNVTMGPSLDPVGRTRNFDAVRTRPLCCRHYLLDSRPGLLRRR